jgi:hypothetical protein
MDDMVNIYHVAMLTGTLLAVELKPGDLKSAMSKNGIQELAQSSFYTHPLYLYVSPNRSTMVQDQSCQVALFWICFVVNSPLFYIGFFTRVVILGAMPFQS